jgi:hypothetical protein
MDVQATDRRELMLQIMEKHPHLTDHGFGVFPGEDFKTTREQLTDERSLEGFVRARDWLSLWPRTKRVYNFGTSYGLKHVAGKDIGYVTNGVFIAAAISLGISFRMDGPNALLALTSKAWKGTKK